MGFFSADCTGCGHPILHAHKTNAINEWMNIGVAIWPDGTIRTGFYDGYGNLDERIDRCAVGDDTTVWHEACWIAAGSPEDYRGPSRLSDDQGWFFVDGAHTLPEPTPGNPHPYAGNRADDMSDDLCTLCGVIQSATYVCTINGSTHTTTNPATGETVTTRID